MTGALFPSYQPAQAQLLSGLLQSLAPDQDTQLFQRTLETFDLPRSGLDYEHQVLNEALAAPAADRQEAVRRARDLYMKPGRLFFALAPHADRLRASLGVGKLEVAAPAERREDLSASLAWWRLAQGATTLIGMPVLFDPIGDLSSLIAYLDHRGLAAHWENQKRTGDPNWIPPPAYAFLARETPERLERYNRGKTDRVGDTAFDFPPELQTVLPPRVYAELLRSQAGLQFVIPASHVLDSYFTKEWARSLPTNAVVVIGQKGLCEGMTAREYADSIFGKVGRSSSPVGIYGYMPATRWLQEQRGERPKSDSWNILLTDPSMVNGMNLAQRFAGPGAMMRQENIQGIPVIVLENPAFDPPLRITVLADHQVIRANELASVYKNLQALHLGRSLFERMMDMAKKGERWSIALGAQFKSYYQGMMNQAKKDILEALELEGIPEHKRVLMPDVEDDMYGSWGTDQFQEMYRLVWQIFHEHSTVQNWQEGMVLLKLKIRDYYSVRNPCYGFCLAADEAAVIAQRWMSRKDVEETVNRLRARGLLVDGKGRPLSDDEVQTKLELKVRTEAHYFFSMIPAELLPEALQIAEQLPVRFGKSSMARLAESFKRAHLAVERIQHKVLFDSKIYRQIVDLTETLAHVFVGSPDTDRGRYGRLLGRLLNLFRAALKSAEANEKALGNRRETTVILRRLVRNLEPFVQRVATTPQLTVDHIAWMNHAVIEALTAANLFYILPPEERQREAKYLLERVTRLRSFVNPRGGAMEFDELFPAGSHEGLLPPTIAAQLSAMRERLYEEIGAGLIELTYQMNVKLHQEDRAIVKKDIVKSVEQIQQAVVSASEKMKDNDAVAFFASGLTTMLENIRKGVDSRKLSPRDRLLIFQALIESLIHTRRFLVFPADRAQIELGYSMRRFAKIASFLEGSVKSPLWHFGNGSSEPPTPA